MHPEIAIIFIFLLIIFIIGLLFFPIILIQDIKDNKKTDLDKRDRRISFAINGVQVLYKLRRKSISHTKELQNSEQEISPKQPKLLTKSKLLRSVSKLVK